MNSSEISKLIAELLFERKELETSVRCINSPENGVHPLLQKNLYAISTISDSSFEDIRASFNELGADNVMWFYQPLSTHMGGIRQENPQVDNFLCALLSFAYPNDSLELLEKRLGSSISPRLVDCYVNDLCVNTFEDVIDSGNISNDTIPDSGDNFVMNIALNHMDDGSLLPQETTQVELLFEEIFQRWEGQGEGLSDRQRARTAELLAYATRMLPYNGVNQVDIRKPEEYIDAIGMVDAMIGQYKKWDNLPENVVITDAFTKVKEKMELYAKEDKLFRYPETVARAIYSDISDSQLQNLASYNDLAHGSYMDLGLD